MEDKFVRRCQEAIRDLEMIKEKYHTDKNMFEYNRLVGKIEGVTLAKDYYITLKSLEVISELIK